LTDTKPNLLVRRSSGEPLDQERRQVLNVLVPKRSNGLRFSSNQISQEPSVLLDNHAAKDPGHRICRYRNGMRGLERSIGNPFHIHRTAFGFMDR
jgi:hypothetical protein